MKNTLIIALAASTLLFASCKKEGCTDEKALNYSEKAKKDDGSCTYPEAAATTGSASIMLMHDWAGQGNGFQLNTEYVHPATNDSLTFTTYKYYISNLKLKNDDGTWWSQPDSYYLVDLSNAASANISISGIPNGNYTEMSYVLGVDSARNVSGAQTGALSTTNSMFWSWNSGYIMTKAEGTSNQSTSGSFAYHLGGFTGANSVLTTRTASFGGTNLIVTSTSNGMVHMGIDASKLFENYGSVSNGSNVQMPGAMALTLATGFHSGFVFDHVHN